MDELRQKVKGVGCNAAGTGEKEGDFPFDFEWMYWESVGTLFDEFIFSFVLGLALIFILVFIMIPDPWINIPVAVCVIGSVLTALGFFYYWDMTINLVTCCFVVMCIGLAVDYAAHIGHMYRFSGDEGPKSGNQRSIDTMRRIGTSVFNAVFTTFL